MAAAASAPEVKRPDLVFALNGRRVAIAAGDVDSSITLNDYIRRFTPLKGTKLSCGEGGCGACAVSLHRWDAAQSKVVTVSANSCLRPLASIDGWAVTTTEGLGDSKTGLHAIQSRIATFNGSQCGFCTPGMVITAYTAIAQAGDAAPTMAEMEAAFDGNICRCTGYRPILDAAKSFARDSDIEDMVSKISATGGYDRKGDPDKNFPEFLKAHRPASLSFAGSNGVAWVRPGSLADVYAELNKRPAGEAKLTVAGTSIGIYKTESPKVIIDIQALPELTAVTVGDAGVTFGASTPISAYIAQLRAVAAARTAAGNGASVLNFNALADYATKIANLHVRNVGSIAGNLVLAKTKGFISDLATGLLGASATVTLGSSVAASRTQTIEEFLSTPTWAHPSEMVVSITVPFTTAGTYFNHYKAALRPVNAHALLNASFQMRVDEKQNITSAVLAYGGIQKWDRPGSHAVRAHRTELFLAGKPLNETTLQGALRELKTEVVPEEDDRKEFRHRLVSSFFYKYFLSVVAATGGSGEAKVAAVAASAAAPVRPVSRGHQDFKVSAEHKPVSDPIPKLGAGVQASGEAQYIDDMPTTSTTLFGAYVHSTEARARITGVDEKDALRMPGVVAYISARNVPGVNSMDGLGAGTAAPIFADAEVHFHGQPIGLIVADTVRHAEAAAKVVRVTYAAIEGKAPIVTIAQAVEAKSFFDPPQKKEVKLGDAEAGLKKIEAVKVSGAVSMGSQHHWYMEPQTAYAIPDEEGKMVVHVAHQWPAVMHDCVAKALGVSNGHVKIIMRRAGGAYGGKLTHSIGPACAAAVAARAIGRPVRLALSRESDLKICGGREETDAEYSASYTPEGKIEALTMTGFVNSGVTPDLSWFTNMSFASALSQVYYLPHLTAVSQLVRTNLPTRTVVRGPGEPEASYVMETIIEHIAHATGLAPHVVRERNFFPAELPAEEMKAPSGVPLLNYTMPRIWAELKRSARFDARAEAVTKFNAESKWRKRGLSITPTRYQVGIWQKSAMVNVYGDGSIIVHQSGCEIGQGLMTKVAQMVSHTFGSRLFGEGQFIPLDKISIQDTNSAITPNGSFTGGSTASEGSAEAARRAAVTIIERMKPILEALKKGEEAKVAAAVAANPSAPAPPVAPVTWTQLCGAAKGMSVDLSATDQWSAAGADSLFYHNYGACVSEVEIDVLTGETELIATDMLYDCGKSLNPAIDIGQAEGAFIMGVGFYLRESVEVDPATGALKTIGTWTYKPPLARDIPTRLNVAFLADSRFDKGILSSKASGEPPLVFATSVIMAVRGAVQAARRDNGLSDFIRLDVPATVDVIARACGTPESQLKLSSA